VVWLHADVPRVACGGCSKTTQLAAPWARPGSGFTIAFEALALALCRELTVRQAAALLRCKDKQLWRRRMIFSTIINLTTSLTVAPGRAFR